MPKKLKKKSIIPLIPKGTKIKKELSSNIEVLEEIFGDSDLVLFFLCWLKHGRNATKAYQELHPNVNDKVASVLGARRLVKVRELGGVDLILESYGIGVDTYFEQLKCGLEAVEKKEYKAFDENGEEFVSLSTEEPDHKTRRKYHEALGKLLGFEGGSGVNVQVNNNNANVNNLISEKKNKYGI